LLKAYEKGLYTTPQDLPELVYYKHPEAKGPFYTSGTAIGRPKEIWLNPDDEKRIISQSIKVFQIGFNKNDRILNCAPREPAISGYAITLGLKSLGYDFYFFPAQDRSKDPKKFIEKLKEYSPTAIFGSTGFLFELPLLLESFGVDKKEIMLQRVNVGGESSSIERRKKISRELNDAMVYDHYPTTENLYIGSEINPFSDEHWIIYPEVLLFLTKESGEISEGEVGDVVVTNLYEIGAKPYMILMNYKIGDWARCVERLPNGVVTCISDINRFAASMHGAKLYPTDIEKSIELLENYRSTLTGKYLLIDFKTIPRKVINELIQQGIELDEEYLTKLRNDSMTYKNWDRKPEVEIRVESKHSKVNDKEKLIKELKEKLYFINLPVKITVEEMLDAKLFLELSNPGELYKGFKKLIKSPKTVYIMV
jgi:phenylacetate-coenzyme A ligase PaaK-like adenylate-forming protein